MGKRILVAGRESQVEVLCRRATASGFEPVPLIDPLDAGLVSKTALDARARGLVAASPDAVHPVAETAVALARPGAALDWLKPDSAASLLASLREQGLPVIEHAPVRRGQDVRELVRSLGEPVWVSAGSLFGQAFCMRLDHVEDLPIALAKARRLSPDVVPLLKRVMEGRHVRVLGFKQHRDFLPVEVIETEFLEGTYSLPLASSLPSMPGGRMYTPLIGLAGRAAAAMTMGHGLVEFTFILHDAEAVLSNAAVIAGVPADDAALLDAAYGVDLHRAIFELHCGDAPHLSPRHELGAALRWIVSSSGVLEEVAGVEEVVAAGATLHLNARPGDVFGHVTDLASRDATGYILATGATAALARERLDSAAGHVRFVTKATLD